MTQMQGMTLTVGLLVHHIHRTPGKNIIDAVIECSARFICLKVQQKIPSVKLTADCIQQLCLMARRRIPLAIFPKIGVSAFPLFKKGEWKPLTFQERCKGGCPFARPLAKILGRLKSN